MKLLRRAVRVWSDPAGSEAASTVKMMLPLAILGCLLRPIMPPALSFIFNDSWLEVVLWYSLLVVIRQRDEARARVTADRG